MLWPLLSFLILSHIACCLPYAIPAIQAPFLFPKYVKLIPALGLLHILYDVFMYGYESWTVKKAERGRIDAFKLWCWRRFPRFPWTARSNQSVLRGINAKYSFQGLMLKLQYLGHLMQIANSLEKSVMLEKIVGRRRRGWQRMRCLDGITMQQTWIWANSRRWWGTGKPGVLQSMEFPRVWHDWATEQQQGPV